ncbi:MAG: type II toxin-antitoxin system VapB family antitoxin [Candidatus Nanopelagicales bacterium]|jgi:Arc/MetJ family transcription regulator|nr:type II toxin-antitoxin system VapB family antitoxin [Candidatus Nanopelagicales bacterium]
MVFKRVGDGRPYPEHGLTSREWARIRPTRVRLADLVTTRRTLDLERLLLEDSTYFGDLFAHVVEWRGDLYLEDGLHRALRAALSGHGDALLHARVHVVRDDGLEEPDGPVSR